MRLSCYREPMANRVFPALLKYWRGRSGLSQLDLALAADVSFNRRWIACFNSRNRFR